jgi:endonuclease YncB( thermonuclease family)
LEIPLDRADNLADVLTLGRVLGRVWIDGKDVGAVMVADGFATATKAKGN